MLYSMTGFGSHTKETKEVMISVELRTLNSKGNLDLQSKLPRELHDYDFAIRQLLSEQLQRGKVSVKIDLTFNRSNATGLLINKELFSSYYDQLLAVVNAKGASSNELTPIVLALPEVIKTNDMDEEDKERLWSEVTETLLKACKECNEHRLKEGQVLLESFDENLKIMQQLLDAISPYEQERVTQLRQKYQDKIQELTTNYDENRLEQELIYYAEKLDISEEKVRLQNHIDYFREVLHDQSKTDKGKKLGFIAQEMNREINTIGSKANHTAIQRLVVELKEEQDKIKEQLANIL